MLHRNEAEEGLEEKLTSIKEEQKAWKKKVVLLETSLLKDHQKRKEQEENTNKLIEDNKRLREKLQAKEQSV